MSGLTTVGNGEAAFRGRHRESLRDLDFVCRPRNAFDLTSIEEMGQHGRGEEPGAFGAGGVAEVEGDALRALVDRL